MRVFVSTAVLLLVVVTAPAGPAAAAGPAPGSFDDAVAAVLDLPYDPGYDPLGTDAAFGPTDWPAAFPLTDTTTGACCTGPVPNQPPLADLAPPFAAFPVPFELIELTSYDGTPLHAYVAVHDGAPGVVVMHGFNTNGKYSVVRYAAAMYANGYSVIAPDHRDVGREWDRGGSYHPDGRRGQTLGWKEAQDLLVAARELRDRGTPRIGVLGFSEGAQNTLLALGADLDGLIDATMTFTGPADQATLADRSPATTAALLTTVVSQPDLCTYLQQTGSFPEIAASPNFILRHDSVVDTLDGVIGHGVDRDVPGMNFYAADDQLVPDWNATMLASRTNAMPRQTTVLVDAGNHAYFYDRWWAEAAALSWFGRWIDPDGVTTGDPTVAPSATGRPLRDQTTDLSDITREQGDAERSDPALCPPSAEPIGPSPVLHVSRTGGGITADGRRSWSGWDDHRVTAWRVDFGDGTTVGGADLADARHTHTYTTAGPHDVTLTITDDTGRTASAVESVTIDAAATTPPTSSSATPAPSPTLRAAPSDMPATGGGAGAAALALLTIGVWVTPRRRRR